MVEQSNWELQPQDTLGETPIDPIQPMIDAIDKKFKIAHGIIFDHCEQFRKFKENVSLKMLAVCKEFNQIKKHFEDFSNQQEPKLGNFPCFKKGTKFYGDLMDMNMGIILENLEEDFQRTIQEVKRVEGIKEAKIKSLIDLFELTLNQISLEDNPLVKTQDKLKEAFQTLRKLPVYGYTANGAHLTDYEWPKIEDLEKMPIDQPIRAIGFNWKKCDQISSVIGGIQILLSNGHQSPLFLTKEQTDKNQIRLEVDFRKCKKVRGTGNGYWVSQLHFQEKDGKEITRLSSYEQAFGNDALLEDDEEIIGIYGTRFAHNHYFGTIGFIVWKPPKDM